MTQAKTAAGAAPDPSGYPTDVPYTFGYYDQISPMSLDYVARLAGARSADPRKPFRYLELGCGNGVSILAFAASYPGAEFVGVDMNEQHIANACGLAEKAGLTNVSFIQADFKEVGQRDLGSFDFIALHGVYSWVSADVRAHIRRIVARSLRNAGLFYCSYNAMPGWAAIMPLRTMMHAYTAHKPGTSAERVATAMGYLRFLRDQEARFFANNAAAVAQVEQLLSAERHYLAHEYFTQHFQPFYFSEVAEELGDAGLIYAASSTLAMNHWQLSIPVRFREMLDTAPDRVSYETHRSFILNERFRRDVYVRVANHPLAHDPPEAWREVRFGPLYEIGGLKLAVDTSAGHAEYEGTLYEAITKVLSEAAPLFSEILEHPLLAQFDPPTILDGLKLLCATEQFGTFVAPMRPVPYEFEPRSVAEGEDLGEQRGGGSAERARRGEGRRARLASRFNRAAIDARLASDLGGVALAAPVLGRGYTVSSLAAIVVLALDEGCAPDAAFEWTFGWVEGRKIALHRDGKQVVTPEDRRAVVVEQVANIRKIVLPRLFQYGILEPV